MLKKLSERLVQLIRDALVVHKKDIATKPTAVSKARRLGNKKLRRIIKNCDAPLMSEGEDEL